MSAATGGCFRLVVVTWQRPRVRDVEAAAFRPLFGPRGYCRAWRPGEARPLCLGIDGLSSSVCLNLVATTWRGATCGTVTAVDAVRSPRVLIEALRPTVTECALRPSGWPAGNGGRWAMYSTCGSLHAGRWASLSAWSTDLSIFLDRSMLSASTLHFPSCGHPSR